MIYNVLFDVSLKLYDVHLIYLIKIYQILLDSSMIFHVCIIIIHSLFNFLTFQQLSYNIIIKWHVYFQLIILYRILYHVFLK